MKIRFDNKNLWVYLCDWSNTLAFKKFCHNRNCSICLLGKYSSINGKEIYLSTGRVLDLFDEGEG